MHNCFLKCQGMFGGLETLCQSRRGHLSLVSSLVEATDVTEWPPLHRTASTSKNYLAQSNSRGEIESLPVLLDSSK